MTDKKTSVFTITMGYAPSSMLRESIRRYYETNTVDCRHYYVDQHYPLNREKNREECLETCKQYDLIVLDPGKNLGLHHGFNWALNKINPGNDEIVIAYDPDSCPEKHGWDEALVDVLLGYNDVAWSTLYGPRCKTDMERFPCEKRELNDKKIHIAPRAVVNTTCAWKISFLDKIGGLRENSEFYGHLEAPMFSELAGLGLKQAFLVEYTESDQLRDMHDREFQVWKWLHAHTREYRGDFGQWIADGMPGWERDKEVKLP